MDDDNQGDYALAVAVVTTSGIFPNEDDYRRANGEQCVSDLLDAAAKKLEIKDTAGWAAFVHNREIKVDKSFFENDLRGAVEIEWHKREGGGGARSVK